MIAHVDANNFYASCEQLFDPALRGRPVVVLSNNDGVIVARSAEARALGIDMAQPFFQIEPLLRAHGVHVLSSNYTLYDDMSNRLTAVYRRFAVDVESYSIDECFLSLPPGDAGHLPAYGQRLRRTVRRWTGLPVSVGVAASKTLAKLANRLAKRTAELDGVCVLADERSAAEALSRIKLTDLWGVSDGLERRLAAMGIRTPLQLRNADANRVRKGLGVVGQRIVMELRGQPCIAFEPVAPAKQNICCSRSFGQDIRDFEELREAVCTFASQAAGKLRLQDLAAETVAVFLDTNLHAPAHVEQYHRCSAVSLTRPTSDTREIAAAAMTCLSHVYRPQHAYKKAGVFLDRLLKRSQIQPLLFDPVDPARSDRLMETMDRINREFGRGSLRLASSAAFGLSPGRTVAWKGRCERRSRRYTTHWDELPEARA